MGCKGGKVGVISPVDSESKEKREDIVPLLEIFPSLETSSIKKSTDNVMKILPSDSSTKLAPVFRSKPDEMTMHSTDFRSNSWQPNHSKEFIDQVDQQNLIKENAVQSASLSPTDRKFTPKFDYPQTSTPSDTHDIPELTKPMSSNSSSSDDSDSLTDSVKTHFRQIAIDRFMSSKDRRGYDKISVESDDSYPVFDSLSSSSSTHDEGDEKRKIRNRSIRTHPITH